VRHSIQFTITAKNPLRTATTAATFTNTSLYRHTAMQQSQELFAGVPPRNRVSMGAVDTHVQEQWYRGYGAAPYARIAAVHLVPLTDTAARSKAACEVTSSKLLQGTAADVHGVMSPIMGAAASLRTQCGTCGRSPALCPGHGGVLRLALPVMNPYIAPALQPLMRCICFSCGRVKASPVDTIWASTAHLRGSQRLLRVSEALKSKRTCGHADCQARQPSVHMQHADISLRWETPKVQWAAAVHSGMPQWGVDACALTAFLRKWNAGDIDTVLRQLPPHDALRVGVAPVPQPHTTPEAAWVAAVRAPTDAGSAVPTGTTLVEGAVMHCLYVAPPTVRPFVTQPGGDVKGATAASMTEQYRRLVRKAQFLHDTVQCAVELEKDGCSCAPPGVQPLVDAMAANWVQEVRDSTAGAPPVHTWRVAQQASAVPSPQWHAAVRSSMQGVLLGVKGKAAAGLLNAAAALLPPGPLQTAAQHGALNEAACKSLRGCLVPLNDDACPQQHVLAVHRAAAVMAGMQHTLQAVVQMEAAHRVSESAPFSLTGSAAHTWHVAWTVGAVMAAGPAATHCADVPHDAVALWLHGAVHPHATLAALSAAVEGGVGVPDAPAFPSSITAACRPDVTQGTPEKCTGGVKRRRSAAAVPAAPHPTLQAWMQAAAWEALKALDSGASQVRASVAGGASTGDIAAAVLLRGGGPCRKALDAVRDVLDGHLVNSEEWGAAGGSAAMGRSGASSAGPAPSAQSADQSITGLLKGKRGEVRSVLMGRRTNFSARAVAAPRPDLDLDQVSLPAQAVAAAQTLPETVVVWAGGRSPNLHALQAAVRAGPGVVGGAEGVLKHNGQLLLLQAGAAGKDSRCTVADALRAGDIVERHQRAGDIVLLNRQPTLHESSINAVRVVLGSAAQGAVLGLPLPAVTPYNADFDGDEMNVHVPQSTRARAEAAVLMAMQHRIVSRAVNKPVVGAVQDTLLAAYLLTRGGGPGDACLQLPFPLAAAVAVAAGVPIPVMLHAARAAGGTTVPGNAVLSALLPRITGHWSAPQRAAGRSAGCLPSRQEQPVVLRHGTLCSGTLTKAQLGAVPAGVVHRAVLQFGAHVGCAAVTALTKGMDSWGRVSGFSVGLGDVLVPLVARAAASRGVRALVAAAASVTSAVQSCSRAGALTLHAAAQAEAAVHNVLGEGMDAAHRSGATGWLQAPHNGLNAMSASGAKGSAVNRVQCALVVGQQTVDGARMDGQALPPHACTPYVPAAQGFISSGYLGGLSPTEVFHAARAGGANLVDTAVRTSVTGYLQRKLEAALTGAVSTPACGVRDSLGRVLCTLSGGDGMNPAALQRMKVPWLQPATVHAAGSGVPPGLEGWGASPPPAAVHSVRVARQWMGALPNGPLQAHPDAASTVACPFDFTSGLQHAASQDASAGRGSSATTLCSAAFLEACIDAFSCRVQALVGRVATAPLLATAWSCLSPKACAESCAGPGAVHSVLCSALSAVRRAMLPPGESMGALAAESIGEPSTQMTLNTFHAPGAAVGGVTEGVPRALELLAGERSTHSTTVLRVAPCDGVPASQLAAQLCGNTLQACCEDARVVPVGAAHGAMHLTAPPEVQWMRTAHSVHCALQCEAVRDGHAVHISVNQESMVAHGLSQRDIAAALHTAVHCTLAEQDGRSSTTSSFSVLPSCAGAPGSALWVHPALGAPAWGPQDASCVLQAVLRALHPAQSARAVQAVVHAEPWKDPCSGLDMVLAAGGSLAAVAKVRGVDVLHTKTNTPVDALAVLGIAGARACLLEQLLDVMGGSGGRVDPRHLMLLVDWVTADGGLRALTRHGINRCGHAPLREAAFEETSSSIAAGAVSCVRDGMRDTASCAIMGAVAPWGTGSVSVVQSGRPCDTSSAALAHRVQQQGCPLATQSHVISKAGAPSVQAGTSKRSMLENLMRRTFTAHAAECADNGHSDAEVHSAWNTFMKETLANVRGSGRQASWVPPAQ